MSSKLEKKDIDFSRGDEDIVFVSTDIEMQETSEKENPRETLLEKMEERGLEIKNARVIGIFRDEFSLLLEEDAEIKVDGEKVYPDDG